MGEEQKIIAEIETSYPDDAWGRLQILADLYEESGRQIERCAGLRWLAKNRRVPHDMGRAQAPTFRFLFREPMHSKYDLPFSLFGRTNHWMRFATATEAWLDAADAFAAVVRGDSIDRRPDPRGEFNDLIYDHAVIASVMVAGDSRGFEFWNTSHAYAMLRFREVYEESRESICEEAPRETYLALERHHRFIK